VPPNALRSMIATVMPASIAGRIKSGERIADHIDMLSVMFADLSGFTALTQLLTPAELSTLLNEFSATVTDVVHADGGRVVKFIGDEVMWVSATPELLAKAAVDLVDHPKAREAHMQVRAGLGYGPILAINGDYFGNAVNLAVSQGIAAALEELDADAGLSVGLVFVSLSGLGTMRPSISFCFTTASATSPFAR